MNISTSTGLAPTIQTYYDKKMVLSMKPKLVHQQYGQKRDLPPNSGKTVQFRKWTPFAALTTPLQENVVPDGQTLAMTEVIAPVQSYGGYVAISDVVDRNAIDPTVNDAISLMADQGALTLDKLTQSAMAAGTNVLYAGGKASRATVAATDKLTSLEVRKAVRILKKAKAPMFDRGGKQHYVAIVGPDAVFSLQEDPLWLDVSKYQDKDGIYSGEIGMFMGVVFVETPEALEFKAEGASGADVLGTFIFGKESYGVIDVTTGAVRTIVKAAGSAGTADPLDQISTVGWKATGFCAKILQPTWLLRVEHGKQA